MEDLKRAAGLAEAAVGGDRAALDELYALYADALYRVAYRLTESWPDAQDIVQQVFVGLPVALRSFDGTGSLEGWLVRLTTRTALMEARLRRLRGEMGDDSLSRAAARAAPPRVLDRLALDGALAALTPDQRAIVTLKLVEGYSHDEIAEVLGISRRASRARLFRAVQTLRRRLS